MAYLGKADRESSGQTEKGMFMHSASITEDTEIPDGYNALSAGPVTIVGAATVTVGTNSNWVVVGE